MNWWGSGFITIINYAYTGAGGEEEVGALLTENGLDILTENNMNILTE